MTAGKTPAALRYSGPVRRSFRSPFLLILLCLLLGTLLGLCGLPLPWSFLTPLPLAGVLWLAATAEAPRQVAGRLFWIMGAYFAVQLWWLTQFMAAAVGAALGRHAGAAAVCHRGRLLGTSRLAGGPQRSRSPRPRVGAGGRLGAAGMAANAGAAGVSLVWHGGDAAAHPARSDRRSGGRARSERAGGGHGGQSGERSVSPLAHAAADAAAVGGGAACTA